MQYEYRVFVVGGQAVTGAGAVEEHTPLDNRQTAFSTLLRRDRPACSEVEDPRPWSPVCSCPSPAASSTSSQRKYLICRTTHWTSPMEPIENLWWLS